MKGRWLWLAALAALMVVLILLGLLSGGQAAAASSLGRDPGGWLAARRYLERRGAVTSVRDTPLGVADPSGREASSSAVWVLTLPWQRRLETGEKDAVQGHLLAGGTILLGYPRRLDPFLRFDALDLVDLASETEPELPPLVPWRWWEYRRETWRLSPEESWDEEVPGVPPELSIAACRQPPGPPPQARVLYRHDGLPLVYTYTLYRGRVVVVPADLFSNSFLSEAGNADFLEMLLAWLGPEWSFDEYHHGLVDTEYAAETSRSGLAWDLFMIHLALLYALLVLALVRRFGPAWREAPVTAGSTAAFLKNLGALHRELGHWDDAARLLAERTRALDPSIGEVEVPAAARGPQLVAFARRLAGGERRRARP